MADEARIPDQLRTHVWEGRVDADRLRRYYGRLAGVHTRRASTLAIIGCFVAFVGPHLDALGAPGWLEMVVSLAGVVLAVGTITQGQSRIVEALFRHQQFGDLRTEWTDLWQRVEDGMAPGSEVRSRWIELTRRADAITARSPQDRVNERVLAAAEQATYAYYRKEAASGVPATT